MPPLKTQGIIIYNRPFGEFDRIIEIFSVNMGRVQGIAKGARSFKNRFGGSLEPFNYCRFNLFRKSSRSLYRVESCDIIESFISIRSDLSAILYLSSMIDSLRKLVPYEDPNKSLFHVLYKSIKGLSSGDPPEEVMFYYQIKLLHMSGVGPVLDRCLKCGGPLQGSKIILSISEGGGVCLLCNKNSRGKYAVVSGATISIMRRWQSIPYALVKRFILKEDIKREIKESLSMYMAHICNSRLIDPESYMP